MAEDVKSFHEWISEHRNGGLEVEITDALAQIVEGVTTHHKVGTLTLTITVKPTDVHGAVQVADKIVAKVPEGARQEAFYFADENNALHRNDPRQMAFGELREVPAPRAIHDEGSGS